MHMALNPRDDKDSLYASRKEGGRGHTSTKTCINVSIQRLEECNKKRKKKD